MYHCQINGATFEFKSKPPLLDSRSQSCGCTVDFERYAVIGGIESLYSPRFDNFMFYESQQKWALVPPLNQQRFGASCVGLADRLYVLGGRWTDTRSSIQAWDFSSLSGQWKFVFESTNNPEIFHRMNAFLLGVSGHQFLILGGLHDELTSSTSIFRINTANETIREYEDELGRLQFWSGKIGVFGEDSCIYLEDEWSVESDGSFMSLELKERTSNGVAYFKEIGINS